ncbi:protein adenylyltransferase SelO family protein, partial [Bradyrhizobium cosmicum]|uniref:protein adenylyltransferase SelO family protein n=1 Tax=Bradyrhizobium cosmicum TaxID=1404864 RepID=UPI0028E62DE8
YDLLDLMKSHQLDYTNTFRALIAVVAQMMDHQHDHPHECQLLTTLHNSLAQAEDAWQSWLVRYRTLVQGSDTRAVLGTLGQHNPVYILRNHMA